MTKFSVGIVEEGPSNHAPPRKRPRRVDASFVEHDSTSPTNRSSLAVFSLLEQEYEESESGPEPEPEPDGEEESEQGEGEESGAEPMSPEFQCPDSPREYSVSFTFTNPDVLDCPICCVPLTLPVFQCNNGHIACFSCCSKIRKICPACSSPIGYNRCRAMENIIESVKVLCQNSKYGCREAFSYSMKQNHEATCPFAPCSCPLASCNFKGLSKHLYVHFGNEHKNLARSFHFDSTVGITFLDSQKVIILQEEGDGSLFILNNKVETLGNIVSFSRIGALLDKSFTYELTAKAEYGGAKVMLQSSTRNILKQVDDRPSTEFLLIPSQFFADTSQREVALHMIRDS